MSRFQETERQQDALGYESTLLCRTPTIEWTDGRGSHALTVNTRTVVGTAPEANVVLTDSAVSRVHAELEPKPDGLWVRDLGSRNGTFVDGVRIGAACAAEAARLRLGSTEISVRYRPAAPVELWPTCSFGPLIGTSAKMRELFARLARVASSDATVLVEGETGTGKELIVHALHEASPRAGGPLIVVDCGALPETLLEAELFGHARGAFTGAAEARAGSIEAADGGTLFLDEIGELPLAMQPKLLRALESRAVRRLGETAYRQVDIRIIAATNRDLASMVNSRGFREDLYFRIAVVPINVPPLRERPQDILALVQHFLPEQARDKVTPSLLRELLGRPWYGNVRELRNFVERVATLGAPEAMSLARAQTSGATTLTLPRELEQLPYGEARERALNEIEKAYVTALLARHGRNVSASAEAAGLNRTYLHRLMKKHGL